MLEVYISGREKVGVSKASGGGDFMKGFKITGVSYIYFIGTFYQSIDLNKMDSFILTTTCHFTSR